MVKPTPSPLPFVEHWRRAVLASNLTPAAKIVAFGMAIHMNGDGTSTRAGPARIAVETRLHRDTVVRGRRTLLEYGWLQLVHRGGSNKGEHRRANEYRGVISTRGLSTPSAHDHPMVNGLYPPVQKTFTPRGQNTPQVRQESKAIEEEAATAKFCGNCERGWLELDDRSVVRCDCIGGPVSTPRTPDPVDILAAIDDIAPPLPTPPPTELLPRHRHQLSTPTAEPPF